MGKTPILSIGLFFLLVAACARPPLPAQQVLVTPEYYLGMNLSDERWEISREAPEFLLDEMTEHLGHELASRQPNIDPEQVRKAAEDRLNVNELYIFNLRSHARLVIDFSPLKAGEKPPSKKTIRTSAAYAGQSLVDEEGVTDSVYKTSSFRLPGASSARRLDAEFKHHQEALKLVGLIGFAQPYWFYFYYTDPLADPADLISMEKLLDSFILLPAGAK